MVNNLFTFGVLTLPQSFLVAGLDVTSSCDGFTDCGSCASHTSLGTHRCHWCEVDVKCHGLGSSYSSCSPKIENDHCVSKASMSSCSISECRAGEAEHPRHVHLALAGPTGMRIMWKTNGDVSCSVVASSISGASVSVPEESRSKYLADHGYHHVATLTDLTPGDDYTYHVDCVGQTSEARSFHVVATDRSEASFLLVGDMGTGDRGQATSSRQRLAALKDSTDLTVHVGDIVYADDSFLHIDCATQFCYEAVYDQYMDWMESHFDDKPYMVVAGNHESECHSPVCLASSHSESLRNFSAYNARWAMPSPESGGVLNMWYSFDYGPVHFVALNTETDFDDAPEEHYGDGSFLLGLKAGGFAPDGEYLRWLEADLAAANAKRAERPWVVAIGHRPWYYRDHQTTDDNVKTAHSALFEKYGVDLFLAGHKHSYSSHVPQDGSGRTPIVVTGAAGCDEGLEGWGETTGVKDGFKYYSTGEVYQVGTLHASPDALMWKAVNSETGEVFDTFTLSKRVLV